MAGGKFSKPRAPIQIEDTELDRAFRQLTGQEQAQEPNSRVSAPSTIAGRKQAAKTGQSMPPKPQKPPMDPQEKKKIIAIALCVCSVLMLLGITIILIGSLGGDDSPAQLDEGKILPNVSVAGVNVGGYSLEDATELVHRATDYTYGFQDMVIKLPDGDLHLPPQQTGISFDVEAAVQAAYNYGRTGTPAENQLALEQSSVTTHVIDVIPYLNLNTALIQAQLQEQLAHYNSTYEDSSYTFEGEVPALDEDFFNENAPCQVLVLNMGMAGRSLSQEYVYSQILEAYNFNRFEIDFSDNSQQVIPNSLDLEQIFGKHCLEPVNAVMDMETFEVTPAVYGYSFDLEKAKELLSDARYGDTVRIPMEYVKPEILAEDLEEKLFRDTLGSWEISLAGQDENLIANLKLACKALRDREILPGTTFSLWQTLGQPTEKAGYKFAPCCVGEDGGTKVGGGLCRISSALYTSALMADLEIVEHNAHSQVQPYTQAGSDARIRWDGADLKFFNTTLFPIRIQAEVSGGYLKVKLLGTDEKDYTVKLLFKTEKTQEPQTEYVEYEEGNPEGYTDGQVLEEGSKGYTIATYRSQYSKETGALLMEDFVSRTVYAPRNQVVVKLIPKPTEETEPTEPEVTDPTEETEPED